MATYTVKIPNQNTDVAAGVCLIQDVDNSSFIAATKTNRSLYPNRKVRAMVTTTATKNTTATVQSLGQISHTVTGLGSGTASAAGVASDGSIFRLTAPYRDTDTIVGWVNASGDLDCNFYVEIISGAETLDGDVTVSGNLTVSGTTHAVGAATLDSTLSMGGNVTFVTGLATPTVTQTAAGASATPQNMLLTPQAPNASADSSTHGTAGSLIVNMAAGVNSGKSGWFTVENNSVILGRIGSFDGTGTSYGVLHLHNQTPSSSNYTLASSNDSSGVILNTTGSINLAVSNNNYLTLSSGSTAINTTAVTLGGYLNVGYFTQAMGDTAQTINAANSQKNVIVTTGANTAVRAVTLTITPAAGLVKFIRNNCSVNGITVQFSSGSATGTILPATSAIVGCDGTNAIIIMTGT